ncbi:MAG TPA: TraR/DksA C4-type zinc finger protein [Polyangiales bacterium]|nr:TraR/DksA C4-type zinc finger protein [Polyangiales bacterium]
MAKSGLTSQQIEQLQKRLQSERQRILSRGEGHVSEAVGQESRFADEMDEASRDQDAGLLLQLADQDRDRIIEIDAAIARIADGSYGVSEESGEPIGFARLQIQPWARYSAEDQEQIEHEQNQRR